MTTQRFWEYMFGVKDYLRVWLRTNLWNVIMNLGGCLLHKAHVLKKLKIMPSSRVLMNERKTYYSFQDIPFESEDPYSSSTLPSGIKFSKQEIVHILIALAVLTIAFSFAFVSYPPYDHLDQVVTYLPLSFIAIVTAFFCHEMAHKYVGQKFGYWSEFRMYPPGLLFALFLGIVLGVVFAAPGAVQIFGNPNRDEMGKISVAGPSTNLVLGLIFLVLWLLSDGLIRSISFYVSYINVFLALFNLLPFGPLDGLKIFRWKTAVWGALMGVDVVVLLMLWGVFL
jgi:Zn-dependent protease